MRTASEKQKATQPFLVQLKGPGREQALEPIFRSTRSLQDLSQEQSATSLAEERAEREADRLSKRLQSSCLGGSRADTAQSSSVRELPSGNEAVSDAVRNLTEQRLGFDFSMVRIHADTEAARSAQSLGARAYTVGRDIFFGGGQYRPQSAKGKELLAHELAHVAQQSRNRQATIQFARLRDWQSDRAAVVSDADIRTTNEYRAYMNPGLVWQFRDHVTEAEAIQACRYILAALRNGVDVNWRRDARTYMNRARTYLQGIQTLVSEQRAWLQGEATTAHRTIGEQIHAVAQSGGYSMSGPTPWWTGLGAGQGAWMTNANRVISDVIASARGTPLEDMITARGIEASPAEAESAGFFAYFDLRDNRLHVGREWIEIADRAAGGDPRNVHDNIAHELGGHFEYRQYGTGMADAIMRGVLAGLSGPERAMATVGPRSVYSAYAYPETEIFAELREHGLRTTSSGGDAPSSDVPRQLRAIRDRFAPNVARAIVSELRQRVQEASNITAASKTLFDDSVRVVFPGLLAP